MVWDCILLSIILLNVARCSHRGGLVVGISLFALFFAYSCTFLLAPPLASFISVQTALPLPLASLFCILAIYLTTKRPTKAFLRRRFLGRSAPTPGSPSARRSRRIGASLGLVRGVMIAAAFAILGTSFARLQDLGHLAQWPDVTASRGVLAADRLMSVVIDRYASNAGPTTHQLLDLLQHPRREALDAILAGPFVTRLKSSHEMRALASDPEFRGLVRKGQAAPILLHPRFLSVVSYVVRELNREERSVTLQLP